MSHALTAAVWKLEGREPLEKLVLLALADHADDAGLCWPSLATLAAKTGVCKSSVCKKLASLEKAGILARDTGSKRNSTRYRLHIPQNEQSTARTSAPHGHVHGTDIICPPHGQVSVRHTDKGCPPHGHESTIEPVIVNRPKNQPAGKPAEGDAEGLRLANEVTLEMTVPAEVRQLWPEWCAYRTERHHAKGKEKLKWTAQTARMSATGIAKACERHPARVVADRIRAAIEGRWQGLNLDRLEDRRGMKPATAPAKAGGFHVVRGGAL